MLDLTSTLLILMLQSTLTTITALEHFEAVLSNKYALLPRMPPPGEIPGGLGIHHYKYIEVHPCAHSFRRDLSSTYTTEVHTLEDCTRIDSSVAWWSETLDCVPVWKDDKGQKIHLNYDASLHPGAGFCFIPNPGGAEDARSSSWQHPCQKRFVLSTSQWYTGWDDMTYENCRNKPNAGAWKLKRPNVARAKCFVLSGPQTAWDKPAAKFSNELGMCFVLDKVSVDNSYVEVHPCDKFFRPEKSSFFRPLTIMGPSGHTRPTFAKCKAHPQAVAWFKLDPPNSECIPISRSNLPNRRELLSARERVSQTSGSCFEFNAKETPDPNAKLNRQLYMHVCEYGFKVLRSRWYSCHPGLMTLEDCGKKENAAAWRRGRTGRAGCFVFYSDSITRDLTQISTEEGQCYIRDKVIPLGSFDPPPQRVLVHSPQHGHPLLIA